jgi:hypothetical protein
MGKFVRLVGSALVLIGLLFAVTGVTHAGLKATAVVYAWDQVAGKFQNSNVIIDFDGSWVSFLHELNFDKNIYPTDYPDHQVPEACPGGGTTRWAGEMEYGLYHTDDDPLNAPGFVMSRNWQLVSCDRDGDGDFDNADLSLPPQTAITPYLGGTFEILSIDVPTPCTTGNCLNEIVTTFFVNIDNDCDGNPNPDLPPGGLCFYAEAQTPLTSEPFWSGPLQARISAGGGDKTVNFDPQPVPTAITLLAFTATPLQDSISVEWVTASEIDSIGFNLYRGDSPDQQDIQLNDVLISSQEPGGWMGRCLRFPGYRGGEGARLLLLAGGCQPRWEHNVRPGRSLDPLPHLSSPIGVENVPHDPLPGG